MTGVAKYHHAGSGTKMACEMTRGLLAALLPIWRNDGLTENTQAVNRAIHYAGRFLKATASPQIFEARKWSVLITTAISLVPAIMTMRRLKVTANGALPMPILPVSRLDICVSLSKLAMRVEDCHLVRQCTSRASLLTSQPHLLIFTGCRHRRR